MEKSICEDCGKKWLLLESIIYTCPICKENWDFNFIYNNFSKKFINDELKKNYGKICYEFDKQNHLIIYQNYLKKIINTYKILIDVYNIKYKYLESFIDDLRYLERSHISLLEEVIKKYNTNQNINNFNLLNDCVDVLNYYGLTIFCYYEKYFDEKYYNQYINFTTGNIMLDIIKITNNEVNYEYCRRLYYNLKDLYNHSKKKSKKLLNTK